LSGTAPPRELISFAGSVSCERLAGAIGVRLRGRAQRPAAQSGDSSGAVELLFSEVAAGGALPPLLHAPQVFELSESDGSRLRNFLVQAQEGRFVLQARSLQLHRDCSASFYRALPREPVPVSMRFGWRLLLGLLRVPGISRLIARRHQEKH
jgi:hypothetical protein